MSNLLKEALADAKAVRETAYANAKAAIEETFQPNLQRMISARLAEEEDEFNEEEPVLDDQSVEQPPTDDTGMESFDDEFSDQEGEGEDDLELESLIRELDGEDDEMMEGEDEFDMMDEGDEFSDDEMMEGDEMDIEVSDDELREMIIRELEDGGGSYDTQVDSLDESEDDGGAYNETAPTRTMNTENKKLKVQNKKLKSDLNEALVVVSKLKTTINEVNLLNAKLLFNAKVNRNYDLTKQQRTTVLENLDRANTVREVKLIYTTMCESLNNATKLKKVNEGYASKPTPTVKPKAKLNENAMVQRWQELANIKIK